MRRRRAVVKGGPSVHWWVHGSRDLLLAEPGRSPLHRIPLSRLTDDISVDALCVTLVHDSRVPVAAVRELRDIAKTAKEKMLWP